MGIKVISASVQGASHKRANKPRQDSCKPQESYKPYEIGEIAILAAADGHGSDSCPYSDRGAAIAVDVFCKLMSEYCAKYGDNMEMLLAYLNRDGEITLAREIDREWKRRVEQHHKYKERDIPQSDAGKADRQKIWRQYGTTLLGLVITPIFYFAFQLGDGDILIIKGRKAEPIIDSDKILGTETHSLSRVKAWQKALSEVRRISDNEDELAFMIATDGFSNSYHSEADFLKTCEDYFAAIQEHSADVVSGNLENWLDETSENGSGDDITVLFAIIEKN